MLIYLYTFAGVLGGILLLASMFMGSGADSDLGGGSVEVDAEVDVEHGTQLFDDGAGGHTHGAFEGFFGAVLSVRFWTFFLAFFGATGLTLDGLHLVDNNVVTLATAVAMGVVTGGGAVWAFRTLAKTSHGKVPGTQDYVGKSARVLLPMDATLVGKVRLTLAGTTVDVLARTQDGHTLATGSEVLIVELDDNVALVTPMDASS